MNLISSPSKLSSNQPKTLLNIIVQFTMRQFDQHFFSSPLRFPTYKRVIMCFTIGLTTPSLVQPINCSQWLPVPRCAAPAACQNPEQGLSLANPTAANNISVTSVYAHERTVSSTDPQGVLFQRSPKLANSPLFCI